MSEPASRIAELTAELPEQDRVRAARFRVEAARRRFVVGRWLLRHQLAERIGVLPAALVFGVGDHGKPQLVEPASQPRWHFNLSHSGSVVVVAVATVPVGVDVEEIRHIDRVEGLSRRFLSPIEQEAVLGAPPKERDRAFLRIWTQKEAYLKGIGLGIGMPLKEVETEPDPKLQPRLVAAPGDTEETRLWTLLEVKIPGAVCIVATGGARPKIRVGRNTASDTEWK